LTKNVICRTSLKFFLYRILKALVVIHVKYIVTVKKKMHPYDLE